MSIEENEKIVGTGSWYCNQSYNDYRDKMTFEEFKSYIYDQCVFRIESLNLQKGDLISLISIGNYNPRKFKGTFNRLDSRVYIQQKSRELSFDVRLVDNVEVISKCINTSCNHLNKSDLIFEKITEGLYVMVANRQGDCMDKIYDQSDLDQLSRTHKIEIRQLLQ